MVTVYSGFYTVSSISGLFSLMYLSAGVEKTASPLRSAFFFLNGMRSCTGEPHQSLT